MCVSSLPFCSGAFWISKGNNMPYKRDYRRNISNADDTNLPRDLCCDGCDEHCRISISLDVKGEYLRQEGCQVFWIKPVLYAGNVKLYDSVQSPQYYVGATCTTVQMPNAECTYKYALALCRKTCKHSKLR